MAARTQGTITNIRGIVNDHDFSVIEMKTLAALNHESLGIHTSATPDNPQVVSGGGTALFRQVKLLQLGEYTKANKNDPGDLPQSDIKIKADIEGSQKVKYELESLDQSGLEGGTYEAFASHVAAGISLVLTSFLDSIWLQLLIETAALDKANREYINSDLGDLNTPEKREKAYRDIARARISISRKLSRYNIGANSKDFGTILHGHVLTDMLITMPKGGNSATTVGEKLSTGFTEVAGLGTVKDHVFLNQKIDKGTIFSKDKDFDFTGVFGGIAHKEALFVALQGMSTTPRINGAANVEFITKFNYFKKAIRPDLVMVLRSAASV